LGRDFLWLNFPDPGWVFRLWFKFDGGLTLPRWLIKFGRRNGVRRARLSNLFPALAPAGKTFARPMWSIVYQIALSPGHFRTMLAVTIGLPKRPPEDGCQIAGHRAARRK
jgi:hypothetical protein